MICKRTGKPYKFFEDLYLGMNAHFVRHHPAEHSEMMEKHVEALVNGEWLQPKSIVVDDAFAKDKKPTKKEQAIPEAKPEPEKEETPVDEVVAEGESMPKQEKKFY